MKSILVVFLLFLTTTALAEDRLARPELEARAQAIMKELRCLVCQGESVAESGADFAQDIRILVRQQVNEGKSKEEVLAFMRERYGDYILMAPPLAARTLVLWLMPFLTLICGAVAVFYYQARRAT